LEKTAATAENERLDVSVEQASVFDGVAWEQARQTVRHLVLIRPEGDQALAALLDDLNLAAPAPPPRHRQPGEEFAPAQAIDDHVDIERSGFDGSGHDFPEPRYHGMPGGQKRRRRLAPGQAGARLQREHGFAVGALRRLIVIAKLVAFQAPERHVRLFFRRRRRLQGAFGRGRAFAAFESHPLTGQRFFVTLRRGLKADQPGHISAVDSGSG
jgi:hypothetical protein